MCHLPGTTRICGQNQHGFLRSQWSCLQFVPAADFIGHGVYSIHVRLVHYAGKFKQIIRAASFFK